MRGGVDTIFTSPPYNRKRNDKYKNYTDITDDYFGFLSDFTDLCLDIAKKNVIVNIQAQLYNKADVYKYLGKYADKISQLIVWEKSNPMPASGHNITNAYEFFIVFNDIKSNYTYTKNHITTAVNNEMPENHKAVMSQRVSDYMIDCYTSKGDTIMDIFMGTGTTGVSCKKLGRKFIGCEIDKTYFEMARQKIDKTAEQHTLF